MGFRKKMIADIKKYDEAYMQKRLSGFLAYSTIKYDIDGLYVFGWESDKLLETRSGYIYEFEIKISRQDFKNDFKHKPKKHFLLDSPFTGEKHMPEFWEYYECNKKRFATLEAWEKYCETYNKRYFVANHKMPNYFYYAVPEGLVSVDDIPRYAGLVYVSDSGLETVKKAPLLHKEKYSDDRLGLGEKFYYNMCGWRQRANNAFERERQLELKLEMEIKAKGQEGAYFDLQKQYKAMSELYHESQHNLSELEGRRYRELNEHRRIRRALASEIKKYDPDFDYIKFEDEIFKN